MRRQRFIYTLPSQDDSSVPLDSDNTSIISSHYSYPETVWSQIISPEPDAYIPYCFYQYPCFQIPTEQLPSVPGYFDPPITPNIFNSYDIAENYTDEFSDMCGHTNGSSSCNTPYGDRFISDDYSSYDDTFIHEKVENLTQELPNAFPMVTNYGAVTIVLRHLVRVDISPAKAVYVTNPPSTCVASINGSGGKSCVIHPNGRVLHDGQEVHMTTLQHSAKICRRGVIFTSTDHCLSYLVDASGTKTTAEKFRDLNRDFSFEVFYDDAMAQNNVEECYRMVNESAYRSYWNGDEVWLLGGFRIKQDQRGEVKVTRHGGRYAIRCSPTTGHMSVKSFATEITIGRYPNNYFVVRKGEKQVSASLKGFNVQNGTQKAGFNSYGKVVLF